MSSAPNDSVRLLLLDMASSVRRGLRSFVDDTRVPVPSLGHAAAAIRVLSEPASTDQCIYKAGKNCISWCYENAHPAGRAFFSGISDARAPPGRAYKDAAFSSPCN